ncbi:peptidoglycan-binding LysM domain-containing protein [Actinidia rufa]|uniref:Peptidoglycan-binding LysM domain-containing protein n=1 Tax=Actinidia rufa TaxID=165716 RepID=A0A7J0E9V6_9ERIC|nr:peptidoglycan-binding LysM domain-containing protein [Actinidia rufa]
MNSSLTPKSIKTSLAIADAASWYCAITLVALILLTSMKESSLADDDRQQVRGSQLLDRPCDEIYVVGEGETLHTISDKCDDPYIVEQNPHIHDPDDVFPGLVIKITPSKPRKLLR